MATPATFSEKSFFGDAIVGVIPENWINASDLREVPDHQEIFLSPTTLSNLIIEINERVTREEATSSLDGQQSFSADGPHANTQTEDIAAALYHLRDISDEGDRMDMINPPRPVTLGKFSSGPQQRTASAYAGLVSFTTPKRRGRSIPVPVTVDGDTAGSSTTGPHLSTYSCHFLLIRLEPQQTDLLVFVNVPHEEFDLQDNPWALSREEDLASGLLRKLVETLEIRNWGLFG